MLALPAIAALLVPSTPPPAHVPAAIMRAAPAPIVQQPATSAVFPTTELIGHKLARSSPPLLDGRGQKRRDLWAFCFSSSVVLPSVYAQWALVWDKEDTEKIKKIRKVSEIFSSVRVGVV